MASSETLAEIEIGKGSDIRKIEESIAAIADLGATDRAVAMVPTKFDTDALGETWAAIELGTLIRKLPQTISAVWGITPKHDFSVEKFATTAPGLVASFLGTDVRLTDRKTKVETTPARETIEYLYQGLMMGEIRGGVWTLVEFDDRRSFSLTALSRNKTRIDLNVFANLVIKARNNLDLWKPRGDVTDADVDAMSAVSEFVRELFENSYIHGRMPGTTRQLRFIRFRKITDGRLDILKTRAGNALPVLEKHVATSLRGKKPVGFFEISVSDFGLGILNGFLASPTGRRMEKVPRPELLNRLLHEKLSANPLDQNAGLGIPKALRAAKDLGAFVSVRTNEFWLARSFKDRGDGFELKPQRSGELAPVAGTHWQFLWAPPY